MVAAKKPATKGAVIRSYLTILLGACLAAISIKIFLFPNHLIDGGVIGIAMMIAKAIGTIYLAPALLVLTIPFLFLAYKHIRKMFVLHMFLAVLMFSGFTILMRLFAPFIGDPLEIIVIGGIILGAGAGMVIRGGACLDGTEILAIIINRKKGFTVGQVVITINIFIFAMYGWLFRDWHVALQSLMTYFVAYKTMDVVIVGFDELKSVMIITSKPKVVSEKVIKEMGLGLTIMWGKGGYSGKEHEILYVTVERLDLNELKQLVLREDPEAFMMIENLHEVVYGGAKKAHTKKIKKTSKKSSKKKAKS